jgi:hypothetical protein
MSEPETFLSKEEVKRLTDKTYAPAQRRVLDARKIPYDQDDKGRPIILRAVLERRQLGKAVTAEPVRGPDFSAFPAVG